MPEWIFSLALVLIGFLGLVGGGEYLVRSASALASIMRISPVVIGLTVVAFGTSAPELAVTLQSAWSGAADLALGNVVGSNIANVLIVLGIAALIAPLSVHARIVRIDVPLVIAASIALWLVSLDGQIGRIDALVFVGALLGYLVWSVRQGKTEAREIQDGLTEVSDPPAKPGWGYVLKQVLMLLAGLLLLAVGARMLVMGVVDIALVFGISELVIGLTVVAIGTSLPEVVTSVIASLHGEGDIAVGNVVGSNLFNILSVLGFGALLAPQGIPVSHDALIMDIPIMIATAVVCLPLFLTGYRVTRVEGGVFLAYYLAYLSYLVMRTTESALTHPFEILMFGVVIPLTMLAIWYGWRRDARASL